MSLGRLAAATSQARGQGTREPLPPSGGWAGSGAVGATVTPALRRTSVAVRALTAKGAHRVGLILPFRVRPPVGRLPYGRSAPPDALPAAPLQPQHHARNPPPPSRSLPGACPGGCDPHGPPCRGTATAQQPRTTPYKGVPPLTVGVAGRVGGKEEVFRAWGPGLGRRSRPMPLRAALGCASSLALGCAGSLPHCCAGSLEALVIVPRPHAERTLRGFILILLGVSGARPLGPGGRPPLTTVLLAYSAEPRWGLLSPP
jgi:hypothetical protein